ncbi:MAG: hypothetical protein ABS862_06965 [Carnobacterium inhibens]
MKSDSELVELRLIAPTQIKSDSELVELRFIAPTQIESDSELVELNLIVPTQIESSTELVELNLIVPTQMRFYIKPTFFFLLNVESDHFRSSVGLSQHGTIKSQTFI